MAKTSFVMHDIFSHGVIIVGVCFVVAYDWSTLGPTLAIQHGALAGVLAWIVVVPLGALLGSVSTLALVFFSIIAWICLTLAAGPAGCMIGGILVIVVTCLMGFFASLLEGPTGELLVFVAVFFAVRSYAALSIGVQNMNQWPYLTEIDQKSSEYQQQRDFFLASCMPWEHKFDFGLKIERIYRVARPNDAPLKVGGEGVRQLFHGSPWEGAKGIVCDGLRLPNNPGMFGKGLYFADCPLKCWRYCFSSRQASQLIPRVTGRGGLIFICWVDLGEMREEKEARTDLAGYDRGGWKAWFTGGRGAYDSVKAVEQEEGGAVRVPEYVVYRTDQVRLAYLVEVKTCEKRASPRN